MGSRKVAEEPQVLMGMQRENVRLKRKLDRQAKKISEQEEEIRVLRAKLNIRDEII